MQMEHQSSSHSTGLGPCGPIQGTIWAQKPGKKGGFQLTRKEPKFLLLDAVLHHTHCSDHGISIVQHHAATHEAQILEVAELLYANIGPHA